MPLSSDRWGGALLRRCALGALLAGVLTLSACGLGELSELTESTPGAFALPGRRLAEGRFSRLSWTYATGEGHVFLAINHDEATPRLAIHRPASGTCFVEAASDYFLTRSTAESAGLVASGLGSLTEAYSPVTFSGFDCTEVMSFSSARLAPFYFPPGTGEGVVLAQGDGSVVYLNATTGELVELQTGVDRMFGSSVDGLWTLSGDILRHYTSSQGAPSVATGITDLVAEEHGGRFAYRGGSFLFYRSESGSVLLGEDACAPVLLPQGIAYFSPCAEQRVVVHARGDIEPQEQSIVQQARSTPLDYEGIVLESIRFGHGVPRSIVFVTNLDPVTRTGDLWVAGPDGVATYVGAGAPAQGGLYLNWDGEAGRLVTLQLTEDEGHVTLESVTTVAEGVRQMFTPDLLLAHFDGTVGDLVTRGGLLVARGVPPQFMRFITETTATFVADLEGAVGTLFLLSMQPFQLTPLVRGVVPGTVRQSVSPRSLLYLTNPRGTVGTLRAYLLDAEFEQTIASGVATGDYMTDANRLVYLVSEGPEAGIYVAFTR